MDGALQQAIRERDRLRDDYYGAAATIADVARALAMGPGFTSGELVAQVVGLRNSLDQREAEMVELAQTASAEAERVVWAAVRDAVTQLADTVVDLDQQVSALRGAETMAGFLHAAIHDALTAAGVPESQSVAIPGARSAVDRITALAAERDRLARVLAVERGDASQAPEGSDA